MKAAFASAILLTFKRKVRTIDLYKCSKSAAIKVNKNETLFIFILLNHLTDIKTKIRVDKVIF